MKSVLKLVFVFTFLFAFLVFSSCENFLASSNNFRDQMAEEVKTSVALRVDVEIWPLDPDHGRVSSTELKELLVGESFRAPIKFDLNSDYYHFSRWVAYKNFNTTKKEGEILGSDIIIFDNPTLEETYVTLRQKEEDCSKIWLVPVCTEHPSVVFMDQDLPDDISFSPSGNYQMIKNKPIDIILKYPEAYGFDKIDFFIGNTSDYNHIPVIERNLFDDEPFENFILKTETAPAENDPVAAKAVAVIYNEEQVLEGNKKFTFSMVLPNNLSEKNLYVVPSVYKHPVVNFVDLENASIKPSGKVVVEENKDFENLSVVTDSNFGCLDWEAYITDSEGKTNLSVYRDSDKFWNSIGDYVYVTKDKSIFDDEGNLKSYAKFEKALAVIYDNNPETNDSGSAKGQTKVTPIVRLLKSLPESSVLNIAPVLFEHPVLKFVNPKVDFSTDSKTAGKSTVSPSGSVKEITNIPFEVKVDCDDAYAFKRWVVLDEEGIEVPESAISTYFKIEANEPNESLSVATCRVTSLTNVSGYSISAEVVERPKIKNTNPSNDSFGVIRTYPINIYFNKSLAPEYAENIDDYITITSLDDPSQDITDINSGKVYFLPPVVDSDNKHIVYQTIGGKDPNKWMKSRSFVTVTISGEIKDIDGIPFGNDYEFSFTLGSKGDTEGPLITCDYLFINEHNYELGDDLYFTGLVKCNQFEDFSSYQNFRVGNEKNLIARISDEYKNFQFKAIIDADDSDTGGAGVDKIFITERLVFAAPGQTVKNKNGNDILVEEPGLRFFDDNGTFIGGTDFLSKDFEKVSVLDTDLLSRENSGFVYGFDFADYLEVDGVHQFLYSATDVLGHITEDPVSYFVVRDTHAPDLEEFNDFYTYSFSADPNYYSEELQKIYFSSENGKHSISFDLSNVKDFGNNNSDLPKLVSENISYRIAKNSFTEGFVFSEEEWIKGVNSASFEIPVSGDISSNYFWVQLRDDLGNITDPVRLTNRYNYPLDVSVDSYSPVIIEAIPDASVSENKCAVGKESVYSDGISSINVEIEDIGSGVKKWVITSPDSTQQEKTGNSGSILMNQIGDYSFVIYDKVGNESSTVSFNHKIDDNDPLFFDIYGVNANQSFSVKDNIKGSEGFISNDDGEICLKFKVQDTISGLGRVSVTGIEPERFTVNGVTTECNSKVVLDSDSELYENSNALEIEIVGKLEDYQSLLNNYVSGSRLPFNFSVRVEDLLGHRTEKYGSIFYTDAVPTISLNGIFDYDTNYKNYISSSGDVLVSFSVLEKGVGITPDSFIIDGFESIYAIFDQDENFLSTSFVDGHYVVSDIKGVISEKRDYTIYGNLSVDYIADGENASFSIYCNQEQNTEIFKLNCSVTVDKNPPEFIDLKNSKDLLFPLFTEDSTYVNKNKECFITFDLENIKSGVKKLWVEGFSSAGFTAGYINSENEIGGYSTDPLNIPVNSSSEKTTYFIQGKIQSGSVNIKARNNLDKLSTETLYLTVDSALPVITVSSANGISDNGSNVYYGTDKEIVFNLNLSDVGSGLDFLIVNKSVMTLSSDQNEIFDSDNLYYYFDLRDKPASTSLTIKGLYNLSSGYNRNVCTLYDKAGNSTVLTRKFVEDTTAPTVTFISAYDLSYNYSNWTDGDYAIKFNVRDNSGFKPLNFSLYQTTGMIAYEIIDKTSNTSLGIKAGTSFTGTISAAIYYDADIILYFSKTPSITTSVFTCGLKATDSFGNVSSNSDGISGYCKGSIYVDSKTKTPLVSSISVYDESGNYINVSNGDIEISGDITKTSGAPVKSITITDSEDNLISLTSVMVNGSWKSTQDIPVVSSNGKYSIKVKFNLTKADTNQNYNFILKVENETGRIEKIPFTCTQDITGPSARSDYIIRDVTDLGGKKGTVVIRDGSTPIGNGLDLGRASNTDTALEVIDSGSGVKKVALQFGFFDLNSRKVTFGTNIASFTVPLEQLNKTFLNITKSEILSAINFYFRTNGIDVSILPSNNSYFYLRFTCSDNVGNSKTYEYYIKSDVLASK